MTGGPTKKKGKERKKLRIIEPERIWGPSAAASHVMGGSDFLDRLPLGRADASFADAPQLVPSHNWLTLPMCERWRQARAPPSCFAAVL